MRIRISDEEDFDNQAFLWEANQRRSLRGRKGQATLRGLEAALLALPEKRLIADETVSVDGEVCAIAALAKHCGYQGDMALPPRPDYDADNFEYWDEEDYAAAVEDTMIQIAANLGVPRMVAQAIIYQNDDTYNATPEQRYERMLRWTRRHIVQPSTRE